MRLLSFDSHGGLTLKNFDDDIPCYSILSHTWGADSDEVTFSDLKDGSGRSKTGYAKIQFCGEQARKDGLQYFWVDTCCIDKANYTELSEAITSMFRWYSDSVRCYVYLSDVPARNEDNQAKQPWESAFRKSKWFTRGWTLQELIAPKSVDFFSCEGTYLGNKNTLEQLIHEITEIPIHALRGSPLSIFSIDERLRWAEKRKTRKKEDKAYCLLGIFDIFIPLMYGEGENAFRRLKQEIYRSSKDLRSTDGNMYGNITRSMNPYFTGHSGDIIDGNTNADGRSLLHQDDVNNQSVNHIYVGNVALTLPAGLSRLNDVVTSGGSYRLATRQTSQLRTVSNQNRHPSIEPVWTRKRRKKEPQPSQARKDEQESKTARSTNQGKMIVRQSSHGVSKLNSRSSTSQQIKGPRIGVTEIDNIRAGQEFLLICVLVLSFTIGRQVSTNQVLQFLSQCQHDQLFPALTFIFGIGLYRYASARALVKQPQSQSYMILQADRDSSGVTSVKIAVSFAFVKRLLAADKRQKDGSMQAVSFVQGGFHLILGSRRAAQDGVHRTSMGLLDAFEAGRKAIMSLSHCGAESQCFTCRALFGSSMDREVYCPWCQSFHADYDEALPKLPAAEGAQSRLDSSSYRKHIRRTRSAQRHTPTGQHTVNCRIFLDGLTNLQITISPTEQGESPLQKLTLSPPLRARTSYAYYGSHANILHLHAQDVVVVHQTAEDGRQGFICIFDKRHFTVIEDDNTAVLRALSDHLRVR